MRETISPKERSRRAALIRQAIARGAGRFFGGAKLLYPISDYILLAFQESLCLSIWKRTGNLVFTTFRDPAIVNTNSLNTGVHLKDHDHSTYPMSQISPLLSDYYLTLHKVDKSGFLPVDSSDFDYLTEILDQSSEPPFPDGFAEALLEAINANLGSEWIDSDCQGAWELSDQDVSYHLDPLREVLDDVMQEILEHKSFSVRLNNGDNVPNLFAVVRTVQSSKMRFLQEGSMRGFPYTASLLLSNVQRKLLPAICIDCDSGICPETTRKECQHKHSVHRCIAELEAPLGTKARSIFDSVYYSGCLDFGPVGSTGEAGHWRDVGDTEEDIARHEVERCVYGVLTRGQDSRIMYVPIHIGGSPWLSLFTFTRANDKSAWDDNYCFYRDIVAKLSDRIRSSTQDMYIALLVKGLIESLKDNPINMFQSINDRWHIASQIYPFRRHRLEQCTASTKNALSLPKGIHAILVEDPANVFCHSQLDYGHVPLERIHSTIDRELKLLQGIESLANDQLMSRVESQAHTLLSIIPKGSLKLALKSDDPAAMARFVKDAAANTEILEAALLIALQRRLPEGFPADIVGMLYWLYERTTSQKVKPQLTIDTGEALKELVTDHVPAAFTVLWNLWDNAEKAAAGTIERAFCIHTKIDSAKRELLIEFTNSGEMGEPWQRYLRDESPYPIREDRQRGLMFVKDLLQKLRWKLLPPIVSEGQTCVRITIPNSVSDAILPEGGSDEQ